MLPRISENKKTKHVPNTAQINPTAPTQSEFSTEPKFYRRKKAALVKRRLADCLTDASLRAHAALPAQPLSLHHVLTC